jgi:propionate CoA-transferase
MLKPVMLKKVIPVEDAIAVLHDGDVLATTGYAGHGIPEQLLVTLEQRFLQTGTPRGLTLVHEGLLKRVIGGHYGLMPKVVQLVLANKIEAYNLPEGAITHLYRDIAVRASRAAR